MPSGRRNVEYGLGIAALALLVSSSFTLGEQALLSPNEAWADKAAKGPKAADKSKAKPAKAKPDFAKAKSHYIQGEQAAKAQNWSEAAKQYAIAYDITRDPVLFFKLGSAYQLSGDCTRAIEFFERYINEANAAKEYKDDAADRIRECRSPKKSESAVQVEDGASENQSSSTGDNPLAPSLVEDESAMEVDLEQPTFIEEEATWQKTAAWTSVGVGAAFLTASGVLALSARSRVEDIDTLFSFRDSEGRPTSYTPDVQKRYETLKDERKDLTRLSWISLGLAGASAVTATVFFLLDDSPNPEDGGLSHLSPHITGDSFGMNAGFNF